ncbi:MAG: ABC transporter permease [Solirubrobacteraceae bacterium]
MSDLSLVASRTSPVKEARTLIVRALRLTLRNPEALPTAFALPVMLLLMFVYLFGGAIHTGTHYVDYVVPGVVLVCVGFGAATTAVSVSHDLTSGVIDRFRSIDVRGETLTGGHVIASVLRNLCSTMIVLAVALAVGFRAHGDPAAWLAAVGILVLYVLALSWFAAAIGILAKSPEAAQGVTFFVSFLPYPSSAFVPIHTMPAGLRAFASHQPVTAVANAIRELLNGQPAGTDCLHAVIWSLGILAASVVLAGVLYRRRLA